MKISNTKKTSKELFSNYKMGEITPDAFIEEIVQVHEHN